MPYCWRDFSANFRTVSNGTGRTAAVSVIQNTKARGTRTASVKNLWKKPGSCSCPRKSTIRNCSTPRRTDFELDLVERIRIRGWGCFGTICCQTVLNRISGRQIAINGLIHQQRKEVRYPSSAVPCGRDAARVLSRSRRRIKASIAADACVPAKQIREIT